MLRYDDWRVGISGQRAAVLNGLELIMLAAYGRLVRADWHLRRGGAAELCCFCDGVANKLEIYRLDLVHNGAAWRYSMWTGYIWIQFASARDTHTHTSRL